MTWPEAIVEIFKKLLSPWVILALLVVFLVLSQNVSFDKFTDKAANVAKEAKPEKLK